jgi:hypothetical protein
MQLQMPALNGIEAIIGIRSEGANERSQAVTIALGREIIEL